ncbi:hypothetical protein AB0P45_32725, partial [Streptomyces niveus]
SCVHLQVRVLVGPQGGLRRVEGAALAGDVLLWSDPENEPPKEMRDMQAMMRRAGMILSFAMVLWMIVSGIR